MYRDQWGDQSPPLHQRLARPWGSNVRGQPRFKQSLDHFRSLRCNVCPAEGNINYYIITSADRQTRGALPHAPIPVLDPTLYTESTRPGLVGSCCRAPQPHNHTHHPILHNQQLLRQSSTQKLMEEDQTSAMSRVFTGWGQLFLLLLDGERTCLNLDPK